MRSKQRVVDFAKLEHHEPATALEDAMRLCDYTVNMGTVSNAEGNRVRIQRVIENSLKYFGIALREGDMLT